MEIGETFEMAVAREVKEESGIDIDRTSVRCLSPFPLPSLCHCILHLYMLLYSHIRAALAPEMNCAGYGKHELFT